MKKATLILLTVLSLSLGLAEISKAQEYVLTLNLMIAPIHNRWKSAIKPWVDEIEKRSNGRIKIEPYFAEALSKQADVIDSVRTGVADLGESHFSVGIGRFPFHEQLLNNVLPSNCLTDPAAIMRGMQAAFPEQAGRDYAGTKLLFTEALSLGMVIGTRDKPVTSLADLQGLKLGITGGGVRLERAQALGASVVGVTSPDLYMSLEKGVMDGAVVDFELMISRRLGDLIKHITLVNMGSTVFYCVMNPDAYNRLPDELKKVIDDVSGEFAQKLFTGFWDGMEFTSLEKWQKEMGGQLHVLSAEDYAKVDAIAAKPTSDWVTFMNSKGLPGEAMLQKFRELEKQHTVPWLDSKLMNYVKK